MKPGMDWLLTLVGIRNLASSLLASRDWSTAIPYVTRRPLGTRQTLLDGENLWASAVVAAARTPKPSERLATGWV